MLFSEQEPFVCALDDICKADFNYFAKNRNIVSCEFSNIISSYEKKDGCKRFYHLNYLYNSLIGCNDYKFLLVNHSGCNWYFPYKVIHIVKTRQIRFFDLPISEKDESEKSVVFDIITELAKLDFVRFIFQERNKETFNEINLPNKKTARLATNDEFFYNIFYNSEIYTSNRWRRKHFINIVEGSSDFSIELSFSVNICETTKLRELWSIGMAQKKDYVRYSTEKGFQKFIRNVEKNNLRVISIRYKGELIAQEFFLIDNIKKTCESVFCIHVFDYCKNDIIIKHVGYKMVAIQKYLSWKYLKDEFQQVWVGTGANANLYKHKERTCDGKIKYYII